MGLRSEQASRGAAAAYAVSLLFACGAASTDTSVPAGPAGTSAPVDVRAPVVTPLAALTTSLARQPVGGITLVWADAWLRSAPDSEVRGRFEPFLDDPPPREQLVGHAMPVRVVTDRGDWVEVETLDAPDAAAQCTRPEPRASRLRLRLFVRRTDLAPVTREAVDAFEPDGSGVSLRAGTPVGAAEPDGRRRVHAYSLDVRARIPEERLALSYEPPDSAFPSYPEPPYVHVRDLQRVLIAGRAIGTITARLDAPFELHLVRSYEPRDGGFVATLAYRCVLLVAFTEESNLDFDSPNAVQGGVSRSRDERPITGVVPAHTPLTFLDGRTAGETRVPVALHGPPTGPPGRACFASGLAGPGSALLVCAEATAVQSR